MYLAWKNGFQNMILTLTIFFRYRGTLSLQYARWSLSGWWEDGLCTPCAHTIQILCEISLKSLATVHIWEYKSYISLNYLISKSRQLNFAFRKLELNNIFSNEIMCPPPCAFLSPPGTNLHFGGKIPNLWPPNQQGWVIVTIFCFKLWNCDHPSQTLSKLLSEIWNNEIINIKC